MALTEIQLPSKANFYQKIQVAANNMNLLLHEWEDLAEFIGVTGTADLDAMAVPTGQIRTDLTAFRTVLDEVTAFMSGTSTTQTKVPADIIDKMRSM